MIIYHLGHYGLLSKCITHKVTFHRNQSAIFLIDEKLSSPSTKEYLSKIKGRFEERGIAKIVTYNEDIFINEESEDLLKDKILLFFDHLIENQEIEKVYSGFDTFNAFGVYLSIRQIRYSLIELARGFYETNRYYLNNKKVYDDLLYHYQCLSSDNDWVDEVYRIYEEDVKNEKPKDIFIDYQKIEMEFNEQIKMDIFYCFNVERMSEIQGNYNLLVCSSYWVIYHLRLRENEYFKTYHRILDFFSDEDLGLIIKPHPNSYFDISNWENAYEGTIVIPSGFPSSYMHLFSQLRVCNVIGTNSSGLDLIYPNSEIFNLPLIHSFKYREQLVDFYILFELSKRLKNHKFYVTGIDVELLNIYFSLREKNRISFSGFNKCKIYEDAIFYVNEVSAQDISDLLLGLMDANDNAIVLFSSFGKKITQQLSGHMQLLSCFIGLDIHLIDLQGNEKKETIYIYCKSKEKRKKICQLMFTKFLFYSGEALVAVPHKWYEDITLMKMYGEELKIR